MKQDKDTICFAEDREQKEPCWPLLYEYFSNGIYYINPISVIS